MQKQTLRLSLVVLAILFSAFVSATPSNSSPRPLRKSEVLALVAGKIQPENIVFQIQSRGLSFTPDENYKSLLKAAGADPKVLVALTAAKIASREPADSAENSALLQHLSTAGRMIRASRFDEATNELSAAITGGSGRLEAGFVMGMVLLDQQRSQEAGQLYSQILERDPDFPEVHARLSATYFEIGDPENALREAKAALAENPNNPVAHLNAGADPKVLVALIAAKLPRASRRIAPKTLLCFNI